MQILQSERFNTILHRRLEWAMKNNISSEAVKTVMNALHEESIRCQQ